ncbi:hypothetical protein ACN47E_007793 [Coniothyrium glycines]
MSSSFPTRFSSKSQYESNPAQLATGISQPDTTTNPRQTYNTSPFGHIEQNPFGFSYNTPSLQRDESAYFSLPVDAPSRTPSLCGDVPQQSYSPSFSPRTKPQQHAFSPTISPRVIKEETPCSPQSLSEEASPKRTQRKRGRPRLDRSKTGSQSSASMKGRRPTRLPHNQVERKYREGLNSELERLRKTVPTLPQNTEGDLLGQPKPSKAMVLSSAIDYIKKIERERDLLRAENEILRQSQRTNFDVSTNMDTWRGEDTALYDFLRDM